MLIRFNVKNFLSFNAREDNRSEEFSMLAGKVRNKKEHVIEQGNLRLLKFAALYGANAAGKSNFVKALNFMRTTLVTHLPEGHTERYCKLDAANKQKPSYFELELLLNGQCYAYGFEVILSQSKFISEWLIELQPNGNDKVIFIRDIENKSYQLSSALKADKELASRMKVYIEDICADSSVLFLRTLNTNKKTLYEDYPNAQLFQDIYQWILKKLEISNPGQAISSYSSYLQAADGTKDVQEICCQLSALGIGITDFQMVEIALEQVLKDIPNTPRRLIEKELEETKAKLLREDKVDKLSKVQFIMRSKKDFFVLRFDQEGNIRCQTIEFKHGKQGGFFRLDEESDGTVRILDLLEILLAKEDKTYVIDELDRCLHPSLTYRFIETFFQIAKTRNVQLIVTTHESRLLDFDLLRRDEVWFVDKAANGQSSIYSLEEYNTRFDQKIDKAYLEGRYGGVPIFNTLFPITEE